MAMTPFRSGLIAVSVMASGTALAADIPPRPASPAYAAPQRPYDIVLEIGGGPQIRPAYEGADKYKVMPFGEFTLHYLWLPGFGEIKNGQVTDGFSFGPSFRYLSRRKSSDYTDLHGLNDVDASFEVGAKFAYTFGMFRPWVAVRHGFGGHSGVVGEAGLDLVMRPTPVTEIAFGPRTSFASSDYMETYFGVTPAESARSGLAVYSPGGGFKGVGAELRTRYEFSPQWAMVGTLIYERLIGDAADSPIVQVGDANQFTAKLGLTYRFGLKLFN